MLPAETTNIAKLVLSIPNGEISKPLNVTSDVDGKLWRDDRLQRQKLLARGGMGMVYLADDRNCRRTVAMKVLDQSQANDREKKLRFIVEAQITAQLEHPNIVPVHELSEDADGNAYYAMKHVTGTTLQAVLTALNKGDRAAIAEWPLPRLLNVLDKVCDAVAFAHSRGVIHRDLKPANIMLGDFGEVLVMDWGIAIIHGAAASTTSVQSIRQDLTSCDPIHTLDGVVVGTPGFMSPEQARGEVSSIGPASDIYSLGTILYSILTLRGPIEPGSVEEMLEQTCTGRFAPPSTLNASSSRLQYTPSRDRQKQRVSAKDFSARASASLKRSQTGEERPHLPNGQVPESLSAVCMKALALKPQNRYATVPKMQNDLRAWQQGFATGAEDAGIVRQLNLFFHRHRLEVILAGTAVLLVIGLTFAFMFKLATSEERAVEAMRKAEHNLLELKTEQLERRRITRAALPAFLELANKRLEQYRWDETLQMAEVAASLEPELARPHVLSGRALMGQRRFAEAKAAFALAVEKSVVRTEADAYAAICEKALALVQQHGANSRHEVSQPVGRELQLIGDIVLANWFLGR